MDPRYSELFSFWPTCSYYFLTQITCQNKIKKSFGVDTSEDKKKQHQAMKHMQHMTCPYHYQVFGAI